MIRHKTCDIKVHTGTTSNTPPPEDQAIISPSLAADSISLACDL